MTDKELKKLSRLQLLELLLEQSKENEQLRQDNEAYRLQESAQPVATANFDPAVFAGFSEFAEKIDSSLTETRKATQSYIERLAYLAEFAEKSVVGASADAAPSVKKKTGSASFNVTDEEIAPEPQKIIVPVPVKPLAKSRPVKKLDVKAAEVVPADAAVIEPAVQNIAPSPVEAEGVVMPQQGFVPVGAYPVMGAPVYPPVPMYYPAPAPVSVPIPAPVPKASVERREENGVTVRPLSKKKTEPAKAENKDSELVDALADFYFENQQMLEMLPEELKKQIVTRFKR